MTAQGEMMVGKGMDTPRVFAAMPFVRALLGLVPSRSGPAEAPLRRAGEAPVGVTAAAPQVFRREVPIRFAHCDPAGIVFYPQYFVILNGLMEDWFTEGLGVDFADMVARRRIGIPTVQIDCTFSRPSALGERLTLAVAITRIGDKSISIEVTGSADGELRLRARQTLVLMCLATRKSIAIPSDIRQALVRVCHAAQRDFASSQGGSHAS